jgi:hypothetical protein
VNRCFAGDASFCALVNNGTGLGTSINRVFNGFLNINTLATRGIDIEAAYDMPLSLGVRGSDGGAARARGCA